MKIPNKSRKSGNFKQSTINHQQSTVNQKPLTILIYSLASGGAERQVSYLVNKLSKKYKIKLVLMRNEVFYDIPDDVEIVLLEDSDPSESGIKKLLKIPFLAYRFAKIKNNVVISFMNRPNYINILSNIFKKSKTIVSERGFPSIQYEKGVRGWINRLLIKVLYPRSDIVVTNSEANKTDLLKFGVNNSIVIYNGINIGKILSSVEEDMEISKNGFTFITVGRLNKGKNVSLLIDALKGVEANMWIIGDGPLREYLKSKIEKDGLSDRVKLLGVQKNPFKFLAKADCFVFGSLHEGFPNVLLEALACGLPVISTNCQGGVRELLAPKTESSGSRKIEIGEYGILVPVNNTDKMREAMKLIIKRSDIRNKLTEKAKKRAEDFNIEKIIKNWEELIEKL